MFIEVAVRDQVTPGSAKLIDVKGRRVVLVDVEGTLHAVEDACAHESGPLSEGELEGDVLRCPWHGWTFDVTSGASVSDVPACVRRFPVEVRDGNVFVGDEPLASGAT